METYLIGNILKENRIRLGISQEELCFDLCAVSTLSRIESGAQVPGRKLVEALFSRMGMNPPASAIPMSKIDFKRENLEYKINDMIATGKFEIADLLEEYKNCGGELAPLENQFYLFYKALSEDTIHHDGKTALKKYEEALRISIKDYELGKLPNARFLTCTELLILNNISRTLYFIEKKDEAIELMEFLRSYFENGIVSEEEKAKNYHVILFNLENWYGLRGEKGDYEKMLELSKIAISVCNLYGKLSLFPYHIFNKGFALIKLGKIDEGELCFKDSFAILRNMDKFDDIEYGKEKVREYLNIKL